MSEKIVQITSCGGSGGESLYALTDNGNVYAMNHPMAGTEHAEWIKVPGLPILPTDANAERS